MTSMVSKNSKKGIANTKQLKKIRRKYRAVQKVLKPLDVIMPNEYSDKLTFNLSKPKYKRLFKSYLSLISTIALHGQYKRKQHNSESGNKYIEVQKEDIIFANDVMLKLFDATSSELDPVTKGLYEEIKKYCHKKLEKEETIYDINFLKRHIREETHWEQRPLSRAFSKLEDMEYICSVANGGRGTTVYKLVSYEGARKQP